MAVGGGRTSAGVPGKETVWFDFLTGLAGMTTQASSTFLQIHRAAGARGCHRAHILDECMKLIPKKAAYSGKRLGHVWIMVKMGQSQISQTEPGQLQMLAFAVMASDRASASSVACAVAWRSILGGKDAERCREKPEWRAQQIWSVDVEGMAEGCGEGDERGTGQ